MTAYNVIDPNKMVTGQPEDITVILANFNALAAVINGNLDNANLAAAAAIAASKLAGYPSDVTKYLRGDGSWGTIDAPAPPAVDLIDTALGAGIYRLQAGRVAGVTVAGGMITVPFPIAYSNANVYVTITNALTGGPNVTPRLTSSDASGFVAQWAGLGEGDPAHFDWMAVGLA